jgi:O-acetylhomoserine/O-acetylserine sulfhydrylase-like pyridoxal-dependent enzyme
MSGEGRPGDPGLDPATLAACGIEAVADLIADLEQALA